MIDTSNSAPIYPALYLALSGLLLQWLILHGAAKCHIIVPWARLACYLLNNTVDASCRPSNVCHPEKVSRRRGSLARPILRSHLGDFASIPCWQQIAYRNSTASPHRSELGLCNKCTKSHDLVLQDYRRIQDVFPMSSAVLSPV